MTKNNIFMHVIVTDRLHGKTLICNAHRMSGSAPAIF